MIIKRLWFLLLVGIVAGGWLAGAPQAQGAPALRFDRLEYVGIEGGCVTLTISLDHDEARMGTQAFPDGIFSFGFRLRLSVLNLVADVDAIEVVDELDHFGFQSGAFRKVEAGLVEVKGNSTAVYRGTTLARITLSNLPASGTTIDLALEMFRQFDSEQVFVDGGGSVLDDELVVKTARLAIADTPQLIITYAQWQADAFTAATPMDRRGIDVDADRDGWVNGLECVLGMNPEVSDSAPITAVLESGEMVLTYRRDSRVVPGRDFVEWSEDLVHFDAALSATVERNPIDANFDLVEVRLTLGSVDRLFVRLRAEKLAIAP